MPTPPDKPRLVTHRVVPMSDADKNETICPMETSYGTGLPNTYCTRTRFPGRRWCAEHLFEWGYITEAQYNAAPVTSRDKDES